MKDRVFPLRQRTGHSRSASSPISQVRRKNAGAHFPIVREESLTTAGSAGGRRITTALLLAAGMGSRLQPLTTAAPKCLTEVNDISILQRLIDNLRGQKFTRLIVVVGHLGQQIRDFLDEYASDMQVDYVVNPDYGTTNNLYSLWLARTQIREPFMLVESDLIFDTKLLNDMVYPDRMAISSMLAWMNGTTVELDLEDRVTAFRPSGYQTLHIRQYKTVNIYSLSLDSWRKVEQRLSSHVRKGGLSEYCEVVFTEMIADGTLSFDGVFFDSNLWYEIDTGEDLIEAENLFTRTVSISSDPLVNGN
jgi:choline kinase